MTQESQGYTDHFERLVENRFALLRSCADGESVDASECEISPELIAMFPKEFILHHQFLPLGIHKGGMMLLIGRANTDNIKVELEIRSSNDYTLWLGDKESEMELESRILAASGGKQLDVILISEESFDYLVDKYYGN